MDPINSIVIVLENSDEDVELIVGEDGVESLKVAKTASGIEVLTVGADGELIQGWPWNSIQSYSIQK